MVMWSLRPTYVPIESLPQDEHGRYHDIYREVTHAREVVTAQAAIQFVKGLPIEQPLQYENFRE